MCKCTTAVIYESKHTRLFTNRSFADTQGASVFMKFLLDVIFGIISYSNYRTPGR